MRAPPRTAHESDRPVARLAPASALLSGIDVEAAGLTDAPDLAEHLLDQFVLPPHVRQLCLEEPRDQCHEHKRADEVWSHPVLRAGAARGRIGGASERHDGHDGQHAQEGERKRTSLEHATALDVSGIEGVGLDHLAAPAARADEVGDGHAVDEHDEQCRQNAREPMHRAPAEHRLVGLPVQVSQPEAQPCRGDEERHGERGHPGEYAFHSEMPRGKGRSVIGLREPMPHPSPPPTLVITCGDPAGIGPEVVLAAWARTTAHACARLRVVGSAETLAATLASTPGLPRLEVECVSAADPRPSQAGRLLVIEPAAGFTPVPRGRLSAAGGAAAIAALETSFRAVRAGHAGAIVTGPLNKAAIHAAGHDVPGHTEWLARACGLPDAAASMMLWLPDSAGGPGGLGVVHATLHESLASALEHLSTDRIVEAGRRLAHILPPLLDRTPRIAVAALNPHGGEGGHGDPGSAVERRRGSRRPRPPARRHALPAGEPGAVRRRRRPLPRPGSHPGQAARHAPRRQHHARSAAGAHERRARHGFRHRGPRHGRSLEHALGHRGGPAAHGRGRLIDQGRGAVTSRRCWSVTSMSPSMAGLYTNAVASTGSPIRTSYSSNTATTSGVVAATGRVPGIASHSMRNGNNSRVPMEIRTLHGMPSGRSAAVMPAGPLIASACAGRSAASTGRLHVPSTVHTGMPSSSPAVAVVNRNH
ncbi:MAG: hypothetical protein EBR28_10950 [Planctomycetia bacterium]|nr:hypothetical protein [Planctomycetia bacterium]